MMDTRFIHIVKNCKDQNVVFPVSIYIVPWEYRLFENFEVSNFKRDFTLHKEYPGKISMRNLSWVFSFPPPFLFSTRESIAPHLKFLMPHRGSASCYSTINDRLLLLWMHTPHFSGRWSLSRKWHSPSVRNANISARKLSSFLCMDNRGYSAYTINRWRINDENKLLISVKFMFCNQLFAI